MFAAGGGFFRIFLSPPIAANGCASKAPTAPAKPLCWRRSPVCASPIKAPFFGAGRDIAADPDEYRACLLFVGHKNALKDQLTAAENLRFAADLRGDDPAAGRIEDALARLQVDPDRPCGALSRGQRRRASLARLAVCAAALWILDEPLAALDAAARRAVGELLDDHLAQGGIAAVSTHEPIDARAAPREVALAH